MKITVAIPTIAGREQYLRSALATCLAQPDSNLEILISDNSPGSAEAIARGADDPRVRYIRPQNFLTMAAHWEFLLGHVRGDSMTIIGDDDGLMPGAIGTVSELLRRHGNVPIHHSMCNYYWPDHFQPERRNSVVFIHDIFDRETWEDSDAFLTGVAGGNQSYADGPMIYHNFLPLPLIRKIAGNGPFFRRAIPDLYSAVAVAANCRRFYSVPQYLTIFGQGGQSNGALVQQGKSDGSTFNSVAAPPWHKPRTNSRSSCLLLVDALLEVADHFNRPDLAKAIAYLPQLEFALLDTLHTKSFAAKQREMRIILPMALSQRVTLSLFARVIRRAWAKAVSKLGRPMPPRSNFPAHSRTDLKLGPQVRNIADAAMAVDRLVVRPAAAL